MMTENIKYLGIDWGESKIGLALGDSATGLASPLSVVKSISDILRVIKQEGVAEIVIGEPIKMSGASNETKKSYRKFVDDVKAMSGLPVMLIDERLTSRLAQRLPGSQKTKAAEDAIAAMLILQTYLEKNHG